MDVNTKVIGFILFLGCVMGSTITNDIATVVINAFRSKDGLLIENENLVEWISNKIQTNSITHEYNTCFYQPSIPDWFEAKLKPSTNCVIERSKTVYYKGYSDCDFLIKTEVKYCFEDDNPIIDDNLVIWLDFLRLIEDIGIFSVKYRVTEFIVVEDRALNLNHSFLGIEDTMQSVLSEVNELGKNISNLSELKSKLYSIDSDALGISNAFNKLITKNDNFENALKNIQQLIIELQSFEKINIDNVTSLIKKLNTKIDPIDSLLSKVGIIQSSTTKMDNELPKLINLSNKFIPLVEGMSKTLESNLAILLNGFNSLPSKQLIEHILNVIQELSRDLIKYEPSLSHGIKTIHKILENSEHILEDLNLEPLMSVLNLNKMSISSLIESVNGIYNLMLNKSNILNGSSNGLLSQILHIKDDISDALNISNKILSVIVEDFRMTPSISNVVTMVDEIKTQVQLSKLVIDDLHSLYRKKGNIIEDDGACNQNISSVMVSIKKLDESIIALSMRVDSISEIKADYEASKLLSIHCTLDEIFYPASALNQINVKIGEHTYVKPLSNHGEKTIAILDNNLSPIITVHCLECYTIESWFGIQFLQPRCNTVINLLMESLFILIVIVAIIIGVGFIIFKMRTNHSMIVINRSGDNILDISTERPSPNNHEGVLVPVIKTGDGDDYSNEISYFDQSSLEMISLHEEAI